MSPTSRGPAPSPPLILAEARTQVYGRCTHLQGCLAPRRTIYLGSADNLPRRVSEHRERLIPGNSGRYGLKTLVWYEAFDFDAAAHLVFGKQRLP